MVVFLLVACFSDATIYNYSSLNKRILLILGSVSGEVM